MNTSVITLSTCSIEYLDKINDYILPPEQHQFTSYPAEVLAQSIDVNELVPVLIMEEDCIVGFFVYTRAKE